MPRKNSPYGKRYEAVRAAQRGLPCQMRLVCQGDPATSSDHNPPLCRHVHIEGTGCCELRPACRACQNKQAATLAGQAAHFKKLGVPVPMVERVEQIAVYQPSRSWA